MSRSPVCSSAARWMMRSKASRVISSPAISAAGLLFAAERRNRLATGSGRQGGGRPSGTDRVQESLEEVDGDREDGRGVLFRGDFCDGLEIAELNRGRLRPDDVRRLGQLLGGLQLAL